MSRYLIQSIQLRRDKMSRGQAYDWMRDHGYTPSKEVHISHDYFHFRLVDPDRLHGARFRSIGLGDVGQMVIAYL